jgi:molybdopterin synthase catalytic subunit
MPVTVLYFAAARELAGTDREVWPDPPPASVAAARLEMARRHPALDRLLPRCRIAVDQALVEEDGPLPPGAELAVIPPVSGGSSCFRVVDRPLALDEVVAAVVSPQRGGLVTFTGNVRGETAGRRVLRLEYEAYVPMAEAKLAEIGEALRERHGAAVAIVHRVGTLAPGEAAVVIACAAPHREAAFRACEEAIAWLKREVPIWKREVFEDGGAWVGMGP